MNDLGTFRSIRWELGKDITMAASRERKTLTRTTLPFPIAAPALIVVATMLGGCGQSATSTAPAPGNTGSSGLVPDTKPVPEVKWLDSAVPKGTPLKLSLIDSLASDSNNKGDPFRTLVTDAVMIDGVVTIPSGSNVMGEISEAIPAAPGFKGRGGMLRLEFNRIGTPTGAGAGLKARITGLKSPKASAFLAGTSDPGVVVAGARGREVLLEPGTPLTIVLEEVLRIKVKQ